jgi:DNA polymerase III subunit delta
MALNLDAFESELRNGKFRSVYLILGPEQYQCRQAIALLKSLVVNSEAMAFDYTEFVAGEASMDEVIEVASTFPMASKRRLVLLTQAEKLKDSEQDLLLKSMENLSPRSTLALAAEDLDHRKRFYKTLRDQSFVLEFPKLKGSALENWAESFVRKQGYKISSAAVKKIVELAGSDLQSLSMELEKLLLYAGTAKTVPDSAVDDLVRGSRQQSIFELIGAVSQHDRGAALRSLANLLGMGEHPFVIITMMARHCRQVMIAQEFLRQGSPSRDIGTAAQIPAFLLDQFLRQARATDPIPIRQMFVRLADIDRRLKSSGADGRLLLENLICELV